MPTLQVRDLPEDLYAQLSYLAQKEHRSLAQETVILLKEGLAARMGNKARRAEALERFQMIRVQGERPDPVALLREDRDR